MKLLPQVKIKGKGALLLLKHEYTNSLKFIQTVLILI